MSDRNDFDFEDDFLSDDNEPFDFDDDEGFPSGLGDEFDTDMPEIEEEGEERGPNRTFVFLAGIMILLFVVALVAVLYLATRPTEPDPIQLTSQAVVEYNATIEFYAQQTSTQNALNFALTQTAAAWTPTPAPTEVPPTETLAPTDDMTQTMNAVLAMGALTQTAIAGRATVTPTPNAPTETALPTEPPTAAPPALDLQSAFATQVAFATQQGQFDQESFATRIAAATQIANSLMDSQAEVDLRNHLESTQSALINQSAAVATAIAFIDSELQSRSADNLALGTALAEVIPAGLGTQAALGTPQAIATVSARQTQSALATLGADLSGNSGTPGALLPRDSSTAKLMSVGQPRADQATQVALLPAGQGANETATAAVLATRESFATQAAVATYSGLATQAAVATQQAFSTPPAFATQGAIATQVALATRQALIDMALGIVATPTPGVSGINLTATAIAQAFLNATQQAFTPGAATATLTPIAAQAFPTAVTGLPETGIFDDVVGGGRNGIGVLALTVVGLVGVIFVSRRLRSANEHAAAHEEAAAAPPEPPENPPTE